MAVDGVKVRPFAGDQLALFAPEDVAVEERPAAGSAAPRRAARRRRTADPGTQLAIDTDRPPDAEAGP
ncbi:hypothetical protein [Kitasatospora sp. KL5]|uniref:hypothetical protein n=1 Tax=Kitasatospora sp. KL5 TaxID=3425125 RepID=UPI003D6F875F